MGESFIPAVVVTETLQPIVREGLVSELQVRLTSLGQEIGHYPMDNREVVDSVRELLDMCQTIASAIRDLSHEPTAAPTADSDYSEQITESYGMGKVNPFPETPLAPWEEELLKATGHAPNVLTQDEANDMITCRGCREGIRGREYHTTQCNAETDINCEKYLCEGPNEHNCPASKREQWEQQ